jgi:hypothetical protein
MSSPIPIVKFEKPALPTLWIVLTAQEPIAASDPMDVELLSVALPVAHYVLADRRMEQRIKKLGLDAKCDATVYSMSTIDGLFAQLEKLR